MTYLTLSHTEVVEHFFTLGTTVCGRDDPKLNIPGNEREPFPQRTHVWDAVGEAIIELSDISGVRLTRKQMLAFLERNSLMKQIIDFGEIETQIRENLAAALSMELIGERWPTNGDIRNGRISMKKFVAAVNLAAAGAGFAFS